MKHTAILFDLDGTLLDSLADLGDSMNAVLAAHGLPEHPLDAYRFFVGDGVENLVLRALPPDSIGDAAFVSICLGEMREEYAKRWNRKTKPYPGVRELLDRLAALDIQMTVLSNKPDGFVKKMLAHYFDESVFVAAFGNRPGVPKKPNPAAAFEISALIRVPTRAFLYLGDTDTDMRTARAAGMLPVGVLWGFRPEKELREAGAERIIESPLDLIPLL